MVALLTKKRSPRVEAVREMDEAFESGPRQAGQSEPGAGQAQAGQTVEQSGRDEFQVDLLDAWRLP